MEWKSLLEQFVKDTPHAKLNPPATKQQIDEVDRKLNIRIPDDLRNLLKQINGDSYLLFSTEEIISTNLSVRELGFYMPLDCLLFFAGNGCGDYYGYPITREDGIRDDHVYLWDHECDDRTWVAKNLEDTIRKYYNGEI